jgi:hypothetical protein
LSTWVLFGFAVLQGYAAFVLLFPRPGRDRLVLSLLLGTNALLTAAFVASNLGFPSAWALALEPLTIGLLALTGETAAATIAGRHLRWWAVGVSGALGLGAAWAMAAGNSTSPLLLTAYGFMMIALAQGWASASEGQGRWAVWLLIAFAPRAIEFMGAFPHVLQRPEDSPALLGGLLFVAAGTLATVRVALRESSMLGKTLFLVVTAGALLALVRFSGANSEPFVVFFSLGFLRPMGVIAGVAMGGLLGAFLAPGAFIRHATIMLGAAVVLFAAFSAIPALLSESAPLIVLGLAAAVAVLSLPLWVFVAERFEPSGWATEGPPRPTLEAIPPDHRDALRSLTRNDRVLLALRGSSMSTLGSPLYSHAGLSEVTHIPGKHLAAIVRSVNERAGGQKMIASSVGTRSVRHYWLTPEGSRRAEELATRLQLGAIANSRGLLGERWYRD